MLANFIYDWQANEFFNKNKMEKIKNKKGFTLIELLIVVAIITILASVVIVNVSQSKKNARLNNTKTSLKSALVTIVACSDSGGTLNLPVGGNRICTTIFPNSLWPTLPIGYTYVAGGTYDVSCSFGISTNGDSPANIICSCLNQTCN